jgi:hypothetical protein
LIDNGDSKTPDAVAQALQHFSRTPADSFEIVWKPNNADQEFNDPTEAASALIRDRKAAVTVAWAGLPDDVGLTFHLTTVYEWVPGTGQGVASASLTKNTSRNTFDNVIDTLIRSGYSFVRHAGHSAGQGLTAGAMAAITQRFGLMPAVGRSRPQGRIEL